MPKIPDDIQTLLKTIYEDCQEEDTAVRERQVRAWRRLKLLWEGYQRVWYSEVAHDWRIWDETADEDSDQSSYDKPINVFKAYLESIIAALSVTVPPIKCFPDDADNTLDTATAKAGDKIGQLVYRHNDVPLLWLHALFIFTTEGMTACYSYPKTKKEFGTYEEQEHDEVEEEHDVTKCSNCGYEIDSQPAVGPPPVNNPPTNGMPPNPMGEPPMGQGMGNTPPMGPPPSGPSPIANPMPPPNPMQPEMGMGDGMGMMPPAPPKPQLQMEPIGQNELLDEFMPSAEHGMLAGLDLCPACMAQMSPTISREKFIATRLVKVTTLPKTRMCLEVYGGLNVKIPNYAKKQQDIPYLIFSQEIDYSMLVEKYEHLHGNKELLKKMKSGDHSGAYDEYEQFARLSPQYQGDYPANVITENMAWIRPAKFNILPDIADVKKLKKLFPNGVKVTFANDEFADAEDASLDDNWTLLENPLSDYIHFEPLGEGQTSIQEITNDLVSLVLQTIEHGIGQTFADPAVLNFKAYEQTEVTPGGIFPAVGKSGKTLAEGFHELRTATLSAEVMPFQNFIQSMAQLTSGALPSLFGGSIEGSETASQYSMSRAQALQRLQNVWKMFTIWWKTIFGKVIPMYIKEVKDDERDVQRDSSGNFINILIRKAELEGKIGKVELEANENLPLTWSQIKDLVEKMLLSSNPETMKIISAPENIGVIHDALGLVDFYIPGEDDINKQYDEIKLLLNSEPIPTADPMMPEAPSVEIDPDFDNHAIEFEICRKWIISEAGRQTKIDNEAGYRNVLLHGKAHLMVMQQQQMQQAMQQQAQGAPPSAKSKETDQEAPIMGEGNVQTQ